MTSTQLNIVIGKIFNNLLADYENNEIIEIFRDDPENKIIKKEIRELRSFIKAFNGKLDICVIDIKKIREEIFKSLGVSETKPKPKYEVGDFVLIEGNSRFSEMKAIILSVSEDEPVLYRLIVRHSSISKSSACHIEESRLTLIKKAQFKLYGEWKAESFKKEMGF